jgi:two-component system sensor histidine kinase UhpB
MGRENLTSAAAAMVHGTLSIVRRLAWRSTRPVQGRARPGNRETSDVAGRLIAAADGARSAVARELHDDVGQDLAAIAMEASALARHPAAARDPVVRDVLVAIQLRARTASESLRRLSHDLHPGTLQHAGLKVALAAHCREIERHHDVGVRLHLHADPDPLPPDASLCIFRICQEALRNAIRHGAARRIEVTLTRDDEWLDLAITDDGSGFDVDDVRQQGSGLGLISMEERVHLLGGTFDVASAPARGTAVRACVPLKSGAGASPQACAHA